MTVKIKSWIFSLKKDKMYDLKEETFKNVKDVKTALNRIGEMDYLPRDKDYEYVLGWK